MIVDNKNTSVRIVLIPDSCVPTSNSSIIPDVSIAKTYADALLRVGLAPLIVPVTESPSTIKAVTSIASGLLLPGGADDVDPILYGEKPLPMVSCINKERDKFEMLLLSEAIEQRKPVLGICRGVQVINVFAGGTLYQDLPTQLPNYVVEHQRPDMKWSGVHNISIDTNSNLYRILQKERVNVNSTHHQAVRMVAPGFRVVARSDDNVIEAIENPTLRIMGVQFHPERLISDEYEMFALLFRDFLTMHCDC